MEKIITSIGDLIVCAFDLMVYMKLTVLKKDTKLTRIFMHLFCLVLFSAYFACTFIFELPPSICSALCLTVPSLIVFGILSKYKDARFFVTFCFVDTVTLIIAFFARCAGIYGGEIGGAVSCIVSLALFSVIYIKASPYFSTYRSILESENSGWGFMMVTNILIYFMMLFAAAYPAPLVTRKEYLPVYAVISLAALSFYVAFILNLFQRKKLIELNTQLENEKTWHNIAYNDALTGMKNRMAYIKMINEFESFGICESGVYAIMLDIDDFKSINDNFGHHVGDAVLVRAAEFLKDAFPEDKGYELFRIGGDEFAVLAAGVSEAEIRDLSESLNGTAFDGGRGCCFSMGSAMVDPSKNNAVENAFILADRAMYEKKKAKKAGR